MLVELDGELEEFELDGEAVVYDEDKNIYKVYKTIEAKAVMGCYGRIRVILDESNKIIARQNPLFSFPSPYKTISIDELKKFSELYDKIKIQWK